jgi:hypothetical protein
MALRIPTLKQRTRPAGRPGHAAESRPPQPKTDFDVLFEELLATRRNYEDLRMANASIADRAAALRELQLLRAAMASVRRELV